MWLTSETVVWMRPSPLRCKATLHWCVFVLKLKQSSSYWHFRCVSQLSTISDKWQSDRLEVIHFQWKVVRELRGVPIICRCPFTTESVRYVTIHAHCSIMLHKTINKIYISRLLKTHFKPPSSVCNNFRLPSNVFWPCNVAEICYYLSQNSDHGRENIGRQRWKLLMLISKSVEN